MSAYRNIAAYKFVDIDDTHSLRRDLRQTCESLELKGSILISREGINLFLAGVPDSIDRFVSVLRAYPEFQDIEIKESESTHQPFSRMLVKLKREIIAFGVPGINPAKYRSPSITPQELKQWYDEKRDFVILDTRNNYEYDIGSFEGALAANIDTFRDFPRSVATLSESLKKKPVVIFCTGGIRCEKAGPFMEQAGFENVYQLEGGILKYFEECGDDHYRGECFVFDKRVAVNGQLEETATTQCYKCQAPLTAEEQASDQYVPGHCCPHCYVSPADLAESRRAQRLEQIAAVTQPLPGSIPYRNERPMHVGEHHDGWFVLDFLNDLHPHMGSERWKSHIHDGDILIDGSAVRDDTRVSVGQRVVHVTRDCTEPEVNVDIDVVYEDEALFVVNKPAPLPVHPSGRFNKNTLHWIFREAFRDMKLRPAHRIDANTTGLVVFSKARRYSGPVQSQFENREVDKRYLVHVEGHPTWESTHCDEPIAKDAKQAGTRALDAAGAPSRTEFRLLHKNSDSTALVEARPISGRTNQIRLHLASLGHPVVHDSAYGTHKDLSLGMAKERPIHLHAWRVTLCHPITAEPLELETIVPGWARKYAVQGQQTSIK